MYQGALGHMERELFKGNTFQMSFTKETRANIAMKMESASSKVENALGMSGKWISGASPRQAYELGAVIIEEACNEAACGDGEDDPRR